MWYILYAFILFLIGEFFVFFIKKNRLGKTIVRIKALTIENIIQAIFILVFLSFIILNMSPDFIRIFNKEIIPKETKFLLLSFISYLLLTFIFILYSLFKKVEIHEQGIAFPFNIFKWSDIKFYSFDNETDAWRDLDNYFLTIETKKPFKKKYKWSISNDISEKMIETFKDKLTGKEY